MGLAAAAAVFMAAPGGLVAKNQAAAAEREAERKSLEEAAEEIFQRRTDAPGAAVAETPPRWRARSGIRPTPELSWAK